MGTVRGTLNHLSSVVSLNHPDINWGGCAVFAALVGEQLQRRGIRVTGHTWSDEGYEVKPISRVRNIVNNSKSIFDWCAHGLSFGHVFLRIRLEDNGYVLYDAAGFQADGKKFRGVYSPRPIAPGSFRIGELRMFADEARNWNPKWDRKKEMKSLTKLVESVFAQMMPLYNGYTGEEDGSLLHADRVGGVRGRSRAGRVRYGSVRLIHATVMTVNGISASIRTKGYTSKDNCMKFGIRKAINQLVKGEDDEGEPIRLPGPYLVSWYSDGRLIDSEIMD